jgi:hypothetical protein
MTNTQGFLADDEAERSDSLLAAEAPASHARATDGRPAFPQTKVLASICARVAKGEDSSGGQARGPEVNPNDSFANDAQ